MLSLALIGILATAQAPKAQVMVLGTYHFANPGLDLVKTKIRDTSSPERQKEIEELVDRLAKFNPTKIAVESMPGNAKVKFNYEGYLAGTHTLSKNEIEQVGFRLAKRLGHKQIYMVDFQNGMDFDKLVKFAQDEKQNWFLEMMGTIPAKIAKKLDELDANYTVSEILAVHNDPPNIAFSHSLYMEMLKLNKDDKYPGVDVVSDWYKRNLTIFSNIRRIIDSPNDRVLVIYGSGHVKLLNDFVNDSSDLELVSPLKYLPAPPKFRLSE